MLDALVGPDRTVEGDADLRVLRRHLEDLLGTAAHLGAERHGRALDHEAEWRRRAILGTEQRRARQAHVAQDHLAELAPLVHRRQQLELEAAAPVGYENER